MSSMKTNRWLFTLLGVMLACSAHLSASTVIPPSDLGQLARMSDTVVFAQAQDSRSEPGGLLPRTVTRFRLLQQVAGAQVPADFEVAEPGGEADGAKVVIAGAPAYKKGKKYLLFLDKTADGQWRSKVLAYGLLEEVEGKDLLRPTPEGLEVATVGAKRVEPVGVYRKGALLRHLGQLSLGATWNRGQVEAAPAEARQALVELEMESAAAPLEAAAAPVVVPPAGCVFLNSGGVPFRVFGQETGSTITIAPTTPGQSGIADGGVSAVQQAAAAWTNHPDSAINLIAGATRARSISCTTNAFIDNDAGGVVFNDPCSDITDMSGCAGTLAIGGVAQGGGGGLFDGETWYGIGSPFVVVNNGAGCIGATNFAEMMTHEVGHSIGFGHHSVSAVNPTMSAVLKGDGRGAALVGLDKTCASFAYHTFRDVASNHWAWKWIEAVDNGSVIPGCGSGNFCPDNNISRDQMATFLLKAKEGAAYNPPACTSPVFNDMPCANSFAAWVNELSARGVTGGCGNGAYCPSGLVSRDQMAVFLLKTKEGLSYSPPACTVQIFNDVPCSSPFAPWINELVARGITGGCGNGNYCPLNTVTRAQMSVFLTATFGLPTP